MRLDLLSWNLHGPPLSKRRRARFAAVAAEIERRAPEVVLLQEVWFPRDAALLSARLAGYTAIDHGLRTGPLRSGGLLGFVRRDGAWRLDAPGVSFEPYGDTAARWRFWEGDGLSRKGFQVIPLAADGGRVIVLHTHVQAQYGGIRHVRPRGAQLRQLGACAARLDPTVPVLAAGDFNTGPEESLYRGLLAPIWTDLTEATRAAHPNPATQFDSGPEPLWIDYVMARRHPRWHVSAELELVENSARDVPYSDHHGLHARITFTPSTPSAARERKRSAIC